MVQIGKRIALFMTGIAFDGIEESLLFNFS
jgi:hypothetical protein